MELVQLVQINNKFPVNPRACVCTSIAQIVYYTMPRRGARYALTTDGWMLGRMVVEWMDRRTDISMTNTNGVLVFINGCNKN